MMFEQESYSTGARSGCRGHGGHGRHGGKRERHGFAGREFGGFPRGGPRGRGRRGRARRGDIRTAALLLLAEEPRNGYQIMQEVQERSGGIWSPSPGSVYPALQQLEDEGLIRTQEDDGRKLFAITDAGRALLEERGAERPAPWEQADGAAGAHELRKLVREVAGAFAQVMRTGSETQIAKAGTVLAGTRRELYRILADGDDPVAGNESDSGDDAGTADENR